MRVSDPKSILQLLFGDRRLALIGPPEEHPRSLAAANVAGFARLSASVRAAPSTRIPALADLTSKNDIEAAKQTKKNVWVVSQSGLWAVSPGGSVSNVFSDPEWMKK